MFDYEKYLRLRRFPHIWCTGCGIGTVLKALLRAIDSLKLEKDDIVVVSGQLCYDDFLGSWTVNVKNVVPIDRVIESRAQSLVLSLAPNGHGQKMLVALHDVLLPHREGNCDVSVRYIGDTAAAHLNLGSEWSVRPSRELRDKLTDLLGSKNVRLLYTPGREIR